MTPNTIYVPPDRCADTGKTYDGLIVGWGAYTHISGSRQRIAFLKEMRRHVGKGDPLLLSFWARSQIRASDLKVTMVVANMIRSLFRRERVELGDMLSNLGYAHFFTREEISSELRKGGFEMVEYPGQGVHNAVGVAV